MKNLLQKFALFFASVFTVGAADAQCTHTLNMVDSWGDGWNGGEISITVDGGTPTTHTLAGGASGTSTFTASTNSDIDVTWSSDGSYANERSWSINDVNGNSIGSGGGTGSVNDLVGNCGAPVTTYTMSSSVSSINACSGILLDPGGSGDYASNHNVTTTIYPDVAGNQVVLTFTLINYEGGSYDNLLIYDGNSTSATLLGTYASGTPTITSTASDGSLTLRSYSDGSVNRPGFSANITCVAAPSCGIPNTLTYSSVGPSSATIGWSAPGSAPSGGYEYYYSTSSSAPTSSTTASGSVSAGTTSAALTGLSGNTTYYYSVRSYCGGTDYSDWTSMSSFTTLLEVNAPYTESFDGTSTPTGWTLSAVTGGPWVFTGSFSWNTYCSSSPSDNTGNSGSFARLDHSSSDADVIMETPLINVSAVASPLIEFDHWACNYSPANSTVVEAYNGSTWSTVATIASGSASWTNYSYDATSYVYNTNYLKFRFRASDGTGTSYYMDQAIDDFQVIAAPSCLVATSPVSSSVSSSTATIGWSAPSSAPSNGYEYYYSTSSTDPTSSTTASGSVSAGTTSAALSGLTANTTYYYWVRSYCGGTDYSGWTSSANFTTACDAASLPYSEGFNAATSIPSCMSTAILATQTGTKLTVVTSGANPTTSPQEGANMVMYSSYSDFNGASGSQERLMSGPISSTGQSGLLFTFYYNHDSGYSTYTTEGIQPQYSVDGGTTWTDVGSFIIRYSASLSGWTSYSLTLPSGADNQSDLRVGFKFVSEWGNHQYLDNVGVSVAPSCLAPSGLTSSSVASTSATISWSASSSTPSSGYEYYYSTSSSDPTSSTTASGSTSAGVVTANLSGLTPTTQYYYWVRSNCGSGYSDWTSSSNFTTTCAALTAPVTETFDGSTTPACWSISANVGGPWEFPGTFSWNTQGCTSSPSDNTGNSGNFVRLDFSNATGDDAGVVLETPEIDVTALTTPYLNFYFFMCGTGYTPLNQLYVEAYDGSSWSQVALIQSGSASWVNYGYDISSNVYSGSLVKLRLRAESGGSTQMYEGDMAVDDFSVIEAPIPTITSFTPSSLCEGASVTITGTNFTGATSVTIGGTAATSYTVNSATEIAAVVGSGTTGTIAVANAVSTGTSGTSLTVNANPTAVTVSDASSCSGSSGNLTASGGSGGTIYWQTSSGGTSTTNSGTTSPAYSSTGTHYAVAQSSAGCWGTEGSGVFTVNANPTPTAAASAAGVCSGGSVDLTATSSGSAMSTAHCSASGSTTYATSITNFTFDGDGTDINNSTGQTNAYEDYTSTSVATSSSGSTASISVRANTDGNYTVQAFVWIDWNNDGDFADAGESYDMGSVSNVSDGITSSGAVSVTTSNSPGSYKARVFVIYGSTDPTSCLTGQDGEVEDYKITISSSNSYAWTSDVGGYTSSSQNPTGVSPTVNTTYTVTETDGNSCTGTSTVAVTYDEPAAIATTVDGSSVSSGASFRLDQNIGWTSTNSSGIGFIWDADEASPYSNYNWAWTSPATWSDNAGSFLNGGDSRTLYLRARNVNNVTCYSDAVTAVLRKPLVSTSGTLSSFTNCEGTAATEQSFTVTGQYLTNDLTVTAPTGFEVSASSGSGYASSITLTPTDGSVSATVYVQIPTTTSSGSPSGDITCASVHNLNGSSTSASATVSATGTVTAVPTITSSTGATICATGTVGLAATASAGTINWYIASTGGSSQGTGTSFTTPSISATTIYYVDATDGSCTTGSRTAVTATVNSAPDAGTLTVDLTEALSTQTINWTNSGVSNGTRAYWYQWNDDNTTAPTGTWTDFGASTEAHSWGAGSAGSNMNRTLWVKTIVTTDQGCPGSPAESTPVYTDVINCKAGTTTASVSAGTVANMPFGETITYTSGTPGDGSFERFQYQWGSTSGTWADNWSTSNPTVYTTDQNAGQTLYVRSKIVGASVSGSATCTDYSNNIQTFLIDCANTVSASAGSDEDLCNGSSVTLSGSGSGSNVSSYAWSPDTEISSTSSATPTVSATSTRTYTLTNTHDNGCTSTADIVVTVTDAPNAGTLSGTEALCSDGSTTFSSDGDAGAWSSGSTGVATIDASTGAVTAVAAGSSVMTYTVTGTGGCSDASATRTATVTAAPNAGTLSGTESICLGGATTLSSDGDAGAWSSGSTGVATIDASTGAVTPVSAGSSVMTYTVSGSGGCSDATATRTVTVGVAPTITTSTDLTTVANTCGVTELSISHSGTGGNGEWTSSGGTVAFTSGSSTDASISVRPSPGSENTDITMTWTVDGGEACDGSSISKVIRFNQPAEISSPDTYCYLWGGLTSTDITTGDNWYKWNATTGVNMWERQSSPPGASTDKLHVLSSDNNCIHATNTPIYASSVVANSLNVTSGTDVSINSGTLNISGDVDIVGTVTIASGAVLDVDGDFDATGGNVTFSGAGTLQVSSSTTSFGTLTTTAGTVKYDGSSAQTILAGDYYNIEIDGSGTKSLAGSTTVKGDITLTDGELDFDGNRNLNVIGDITKTSGALVNSSSSNGYLILKATSSQNASQALCGFTAPSVSIKVQQSADVEITGDISANYLWVQANNSGTFTIDNNYNLTVDNYIKVAGGILNVVTGSLTTTLNSSSGHELSGGTLDIDGGTVSFGSVSNNSADLNIDGGTLDISGGALNVSDCIDIVSGTFTQSGGVVNVKTYETGDGEGDHKFKMAAGTLNLTGGTMNLLGESEVANKYSMSIDAGVTTTSTTSHTIAVSTNNASYDQDRYIDMGGTSNDIGNLTFDLAGHELYFITNTDVLGNLTATNGDIDISSLTVNVAGNAEFTNDDLKISTGILDVEGTFNSPNNTTFSDAGRLQLAGTVSSLGTMTSTVGTVEYDASGAQDVLADTYYNLEIDGSGTKELENASITVNGDLSLTSGVLDFNASAQYKQITLKGSVLGSGTITSTQTNVFIINGDGTNQDIKGISSDNVGIRLANSANATTSGDITCRYLDLLNTSSGTFTIDGETVTINPTAGFLEMDGGNLTVSSGSLVVNSTSESKNELDAGILTVSGGTVSFTGNSSSTAGDLNIDGGTLTVSSGSISVNDELDVGSGTINQTGGAIYVDAGTSSNSGTDANKFDMTSGTLNLSGGTLYLQGQASSSRKCINIDETGVTSNITTGHTIDIGTSSTAKNMYFDFGGHSIGNLTVNLTGQNAYFQRDENIQGNVNIIDGTLVVDTHNPSVAGSTTVSGTLKVGAGSYDANGTFDASTGTIDFNNGNAQLYVSTPSVTSFGALDDATGTVVYDGTSAQTIDEAETFYSLKVDNSSGVTLNEAVGVNGTLNMTSGNIVNPSNVLTVGSSAGAGSISHTSGIVTGKLRQYFANATGSKFFPIGKVETTSQGDETIMTDVTVDFTSAPGSNQYLTASYNAGHPQGNDGSDLYAGLPLTTADGQLIQNYDDDGYWEITPGSSSAGDSYATSINAKAYNVSLHCNDLTGADNETNMDRSKVRVIKSAGPGHTSWEALTHVSVSGTDADFTLTGSGTGFSFFGAGTDDSNALPVELVSFNGSCNDGVVDLTWQTASENNSEDFEVEYSRDGTDWNLIHTEPAAGFSTELISYTYEHTQAISGDNYYRLTQNDIDGASVIYDNLIINASCQSTANGYFSIFPNPSSGSFQVVMNNPEIEGAANLNIVDTKGNKVFTKKIVVNSGINMYVIQEELAPGIYYINVENGSRTTTIVKHSIR